MPAQPKIVQSMCCVLSPNVNSRKTVSYVFPSPCNGFCLCEIVLSQCNLTYRSRIMVEIMVEIKDSPYAYVGIGHWVLVVDAY
jgi:hypothetical protein